MAAPVRSPSQTNVMPDGDLQPQDLLQTEGNDDSEYDYEYDDQETEDFYFTLDLTTHVPDAIVPKEYAKNGKRIRRTAEERREASEYAARPVGSRREQVDADGSEEFGALQFVGLDTEQPYVKFNNEFFSCTWFTDVGTQLWMSNPGVVPNPRMAGHVLDVIGSSQVRLVGKPASLRRKETAVIVQDVITNDVDRSITISDDEDSGNAEDESFAEYNPTQAPIFDSTQPLVVPRHRIKDPHFKAQADFMERLSALKLKRGEKDAHSIPMKMPVYYKGASNQSEIREAALAKEAAASTKAPRGSSILRKPGLAKKDMSPSRRESGNAAEPSARESTADAEQPEQATPSGRKATTLSDNLKHGMRSKDGPKGGAPTREAIRFGLGLEVGSSAPPKRKPGRPSNAELAARQRSEITGTSPGSIQEFAPSAQTLARLASMPSLASLTASSTNDTTRSTGQVASLEGDNSAQVPAPGTLGVDGQEPADPSTVSRPESAQSRASATPSTSETPHNGLSTRIPSEPATTPGLDSRSRRNSRTSQNYTPGADEAESASTAKPKRTRRRTDAEIYADECREAKLRGESTPPPRQRKKRRTPAQMAEARANEMRLRAENEAELAAAAAGEEDDDESLATPPAASTPGADDAEPKQGRKRRTSAEMAAAREGAPPKKKKRRTKAEKLRDEELKAKRDEEARRVFMTPGAVPVEMEMSFDGPGDSREDGGDAGLDDDLALDPALAQDAE